MNQQSLEEAREALHDYEQIYGTNDYSGNKDRDAEYAMLKKEVKRLEKD